MVALTAVTSRSPEETHAWGTRLGALLEAGDLVGLSGELGAGKTALVRGIAEGAGVPLGDVSSPTFTIVQTYTGRLPLHHADLYRIGSEAELYATGFFELIEGGGATVVEWVDRVKLELPMLSVTLTASDATTRVLTAEALGERARALAAQWLR